MLQRGTDALLAGLVTTIVGLVVSALVVADAIAEAVYQCCPFILLTYKQADGTSKKTVYYCSDNFLILSVRKELYAFSVNFKICKNSRCYIKYRNDVSKVVSEEF